MAYTTTFINVLRFSRNLTHIAKFSTKLSTANSLNDRIFLQPKTLQLFRQLSSAQTETKEKDFHSIINNTEKPTGERVKHEFQAETRKLLDIVARSLYSEKEIFIRELISNASDALEKFRYLTLSGSEDSKNIKDADRQLEIHIATDKQLRTLTIQDTGIGMTKEEMISNLGTIARSGSKAFLEQVQNKSTEINNANNIIGQFGVGFYSAFMVSERVEVYSRSSTDKVGHKWTSDGIGSYEIQEAEGVNFGTKIVLHLKQDCREFSDDEILKNIINKYSSFVGSPIYLNGNKANNIRPLWLMDAKSVTQQQHQEFYRYISESYDTPRFTMHYNTDVPISINALLYFPEGKPGLFEISRETESGICLYTRKVLIKNKVDNILPKWLRFVKGVVDSDDIPLNLSRELLQNSVLIRKLTSVLTSKILRFLQEQMKKSREEYEKFYVDYGLFLKEGIITNQDQNEKEELGKLLLFESSHFEVGKKVGIDEYLTRAGDQTDKVIYYLAAPSRTLAEASPYYEALKLKKQEVLFCYEPYDELTIMQLSRYKGNRFVSVEKDMREDKKASDLTNLGPDSLKRSEIDELTSWIKEKLSGKCFNVHATTRLESHPCVVTVEEMAAARHFIRTQSHQIAEDKRYALLQPQLEINPKHPIIKKLHKLLTTDTVLAELLVKQLFINSMVGASLVEDPRVLLTSMNDLLSRALEKH